jgi:hypothetical protein
MFKNIWITKAYSGEAKLWKVFWFGYIATLLTLPLFSVSLSCINLRRIVAAPRASSSRIASG